MPLKTIGRLHCYKLDLWSHQLKEESSIRRARPPSCLDISGNVWTAVAHVITAVVGSGVLSLAWSMAQLGWIAGPLVVLAFASITLISAFLLSDCYRTPDPEYGPTRNLSYTQAVYTTLGRKHAWVSGACVQVGLFGTAIAYTITAAISMRAIQKSSCYHQEGHEAACNYGDTYYILIFGMAQLVLSQIPDFHNMQGLSVLAAAMSFAYSSIGLGLGLAKVIGNGYVKGSIQGVSASSAAKKVWLLSQAVGDIAYAYPYSMILIEIQDTIRAPPPENEQMKEASTIAIGIITCFYMCCGGFVYAAFGDETPGDILTGFGFYEPYWLVDFANACIVLHLLGGYQVYSQPVFATVENWVRTKYPECRFASCSEFMVFGLRLNHLRLCSRTVYVILTTVAAILFPCFNQVLGLLGGLYFWPLLIYFPVEMYFKQRKIEAWTTKWVMLQVFSFFCLLASLFALSGPIQGLFLQSLR